MKNASIIAACLAVLLFDCYRAEAKCPPIPVIARGTISGVIQDGDVAFLRFGYSPKRVELSSTQPMQGEAFTIEGAYSTFTEWNPQGGHVCKSAPRLIQLVLQDKNGAALDTVDLTIPDPSNGVTEMDYGDRQTIVLQRPPFPHDDWRDIPIALIL